MKNILPMFYIFISSPLSASLIEMPCQEKLCMNEVPQPLRVSAAQKQLAHKGFKVNWKIMMKYTERLKMNLKNAIQ